MTRLIVSLRHYSLSSFNIIPLLLLLAGTGKSSCCIRYPSRSVPNALGSLARCVGHSVGRLPDDISCTVGGLGHYVSGAVGDLAHDVSGAVNCLGDGASDGPEKSALSVLLVTAGEGVVERVGYVSKKA